MSTAIFSGAFDPVHLGHMNIMHAASNYVDSIILLPYMKTCRKIPFASFQDRIRMLEEMVVDYRQMYPEDKISIVISDFESHLESRYLSDALRCLIPIYGTDGRIHLILGEDNLSCMSRWHDYDYIRRHVDLLIAPRNGSSLHRQSGITYLEIEDGASSSLVRQGDFKLLSPRVRRYIETFQVYDSICVV